MLKKGQMAKSIAIKLERHKASVYARYKLLNRAYANPHKASKTILDACENQTTLAKMSVQEAGITPMSLNTLKSVSEFAIEEGGWLALDTLRKKLRAFAKQIDKGHRGGRSSRIVILTNTNKELKAKLTEAFLARAILIRAYTDAISILRGIAKSDSLVRNQLQRHIETFNLDVKLRVIEGGKHVKE